LFMAWLTSAPRSLTRHLTNAKCEKWITNTPDKYTATTYS
jgi:hypothetical protein